MDLFDQQTKKEPKKERKPRNPKEQQKILEKTENSNVKKQSEDNDNTNPKKNGHARKRAKKKKEQIEKIQPPKQELTIPMIIQLQSTESDEEIGQPLQQFVYQIYSKRQATKTKNKQIQYFMQQDDEGNIQYKLKLINPTADRLEHLATQMKFRINEGYGEAYYRIGVQDNGRPMGLCLEDMLQSLKTICILANKIRTDVRILRVSQGINGLIVQLMVRKRQRQGVKLEIRLLLLGDCGSGKSTLLGVLKTGQNDDGKGKTRSKVFIHKHQFMTGTTMTKSYHMIGFDSKGILINQNFYTSWQKWLDNATKLLSFIDVGGHKRGQKQLVSSLCSFFPEYALWVLSAKTSNKNINVNNLQLAKIFNLPLLVVITHVDLVSQQEERQVLYQTKKTLKDLYPKKVATKIDKMEHAVLFSRIMSTEDIVPIFQISNVTGKNLDLLSNFLNLLPSTSQLRNNEDMQSEFLISDKYQRQGKIILAGTVIKGNIKPKQILHLGPDQKGSFRAIEVLTIQCMRVQVKLVKCGQVCTISIKLLSYAKQWLEKQPNAIRRGMVLVQSKSNPRAASQFSVELISYGKEQVIISTKSQLVINTQTTRQNCSIKNIEVEQKIEPPLSLQSKKSKSIDSSSKKFYHKTKNLSFQTTQSIHHKQKSLGHKHSFDMGSQRLKQETQSNKSTKLFKKVQSTKLLNEKRIDKSFEQLTPIAQIQSKGKKKKQKEQIKFSNNEPVILRLRFMYYPQYITVGQKIVINELKLIGKIKEIYY